MTEELPQLVAQYFKSPIHLEMAQISRDKIAEETARVAVMIADKKRISEYYQYEHMQCESYWESPALYHTFMLLLWLHSEGNESGFWKKLKIKGQEIIERENGKI